VPETSTLHWLSANSSPADVPSAPSSTSPPISKALLVAITRQGLDTELTVCPTGR